MRLESQCTATPRVIGITALLIAILLPSLKKAREPAVRTTCASNLRQIHGAVVMYANENRGWLPPRYEVRKRTPTAAEVAKGYKVNTSEEGVQAVLERYCGKAVFQCPADAGDATNPTPVFDRFGTSYDVQGSRSGEPTRGKLDMRPAKHIAYDVLQAVGLRRPRERAGEDRRRRARPDQVARHVPEHGAGRRARHDRPESRRGGVRGEVAVGQ